MVSPYNYNVANAVGNPFEAFTQAYGQGQQIRANQMAMQKAEAADAAGCDGRVRNRQDPA